MGSVKENCLGYAARNSSGVLSPFHFSRRAIGVDDISISITHCGVCYAEVSWTRNKHGDAKYPVVPGHEIVGLVKEVGSNVKGFKVGDHVGVGTYVNSCRECEYCYDGFEVYCSKGAVFTYNRVDVDGTITRGGFSTCIVVHERYCFKIPKDYPLASAAPLLCAGITVYSPMIRHNMNQPDKSLGVIGLGGLGHMAVKFGKAFGLNVTVFSTSISKKEEALNLLGADKFVLSTNQQEMLAYCFKIPKDYPLASAAPLLCAGITVYSPMVRHKMNQPGKSLGVIGLGGLGHMAVKFGKAFGLNVTLFSTSISKKEEALNLLGADKFVLSTNQQEMQEVSKSLDFIIDTASGAHPFDPYMSLLKTGGVLVLVGAPGEVKLSPMSLLLGMKSISGSASGGTKDTKEMLEFCAANKIYPEIEIIPIQYVNEAIERLIKSDIKYRFVIDIENSLK